MLCTGGPVKTLVELSLAHEMRRGHGALYAALDKGWCEPARMRRALVGLPLPRVSDGRIALAVDVSNGCVRTRTPALTGSSATSTCRRADRSCDQLIPGWPYSFVAALESSRTSWCGLLDVVRLGPADEATAVTAAQLREVVTRIIAAGHWRGGDPDMLIVMDAGYDSAYLSHALADLPVVLVGRLRSDRVMLRDAGPPLRPPGRAAARRGPSAASLLDGPRQTPAFVVTARRPNSP
ncbi:transposase [Streptomyces sp. NPDC005283]|uniref:transposase n=1 Tax=Streptomyces sp. NPDC005283 TaxID=3156871 RepID=UPI003451F802